MEAYKADFIKFLLQTGALKVFDNLKDDRTLKSQRISPWFVNIGDFNESQSTAILANSFAQAIAASGNKVDVLYGIPEKGVGMAAPIAMAMGMNGQNVGWCFSRKDAKTHGEASNLGPADKAKKLLVGKVPKNRDSICQLDDVFTAGDAKYEANTFLKGLGDFDLSLLAIGVDRQEVAVDSRNAIHEYQEKTGTKVISIVNAFDVYQHLKDNKLVSPRALERMSNYLRVYGTDVVRKSIVDLEGKLDHQIIAQKRSVIPACDVDTVEEFADIVKKTADLPGIGGYKIGFELGYEGLKKVVDAAREYTDKPIIFDHQKAGSDIPDTGRAFARKMKNAGVDAVILFPQAGPETERAWIYHALDYGLKVVVGGRMTHNAYAQSEGGFITDEGAMEMYRIAARAGVTNFVVPGNKIPVIKQIRDVIEAEGVKDASYQSPGFIAQNGKIADGANAAGERFHGIVGRGIYSASDRRQAAIDCTSQLG